MLERLIVVPANCNVCETHPFCLRVCVCWGGMCVLKQGGVCHTHTFTIHRSMLEQLTVPPANCSVGEQPPFVCVCVRACMRACLCACVCVC